MSFLPAWLWTRAKQAALAAAMLVAPAWAAAATYNIVLKAPNAVTCARGSFSFTKTVAGSFPISFVDATPTPSVNTLTVDSNNCIGGVQAGNYTGSLNVVVENVTLNGQAQGPNVVGLVGTLTKGNGNNTDSVAFNYTAGSASTGSPIRPLTLTDQNGSNSTTTTGTYFLFNTNNVPEPGALWLVGLGLAGAYLASRSRRRA